MLSVRDKGCNTLERNQDGEGSSDDEDEVVWTGNIWLRIANSGKLLRA
jgi:hypothetical protein